MAEAELLLGWMVPRSALWLFVSNHNRRDEVVSLDAVIPQLRERIRKSTGGPTRIPTSGGDYVPPIGPAMEEETTLLLILLPRRLDDRLRSEVLDICLWYGWTTEQEEVLVLANNMKVLLPTGRLLDTMMVERALQLRGDVSRFLVPKPRSDSRRNGALPFLTRPRRPATGRG